jgi:hypothetical protein
MGRTKSPLMPRGWMSGWRGRRGGDGRRRGGLKFVCLGRHFFPCMRALLPSRLAHSAPWRSTDFLIFVADRPRAGSWLLFLSVLHCFRHISLRDDAFVLSRELNKINESSYEVMEKEDSLINAIY